MKARHCNPRPKLTDAVTACISSSFGMSSRLPNSVCSSWVHNTSGRIPKGCPRHAAAQRNAAHPQHALSAVPVIADGGALRPGSRATSANARDLVNA